MESRFFFIRNSFPIAFSVINNESTNNSGKINKFSLYNHFQHYIHDWQI